MKPPNHELGRDSLTPYAASMLMTREEKTVKTIRNGSHLITGTETNHHAMGRKIVKK